MKIKRFQTRKKEPCSTKRRGLFITLEGIEGCGKTTQSRRLAVFLRAEGYQIIETREPGGTPLGEEIRTLLLDSPGRHHRQQRLTPACEAALVFASRSHHVTHKIAPALSQGIAVVCDRFSDSTLAYQGYGRGLDLAELQAFNDVVTHGVKPDLTFLFDLPVKQGLARRHKTRNQNRLDRESLSFHERVRRGFLALARGNSHRIVVIDARKSPDLIAANVIAATRSLIARNITAQPGQTHRHHRTAMTASSGIFPYAVL